MSALTIVLFCAGIALLIWGADLLVGGASRLAAAAGVSPLLIGLTIVAIGTSAPELAVSVLAVFEDEADLTLGNVVGSNIANVLLVLGMAAVIAPLCVATRLLRREVPLMIGVSLLLWLLAMDGGVGRLDGLLLVLLLGGFLAVTVLTRHADDVPAEAAPARPTTSPRALTRNITLVIVGLGLLVLGAQWLVDGAVRFAEALGVSELVIGLTVVAVGTALPEIATSVLAGLRGERDIAVGNLVGSNIMNILGVLGISALVAPAGIPVPPSALDFDLPVMTAAAVACLPIFFTGRLVARWEGALFLAYYAAYAGYLVLEVTGSGATRAFGAAMLYFAVPLTVVTLGVVLLQARGVAAECEPEGDRTRVGS
ncbi:MAG TPA: calcium/sodium antiporter [Chloroflexaceae bacterium]|nr:calcium/sodium antiporter [Chloroflexaceae bacterium]